MNWTGLQEIVFFAIFALALTHLAAREASESAATREVSFAAELLRDPVSGMQISYGGNQASRGIFIPKQYRAKVNEFRGVWITTAGNIDFPKHTSIQDFRRTVSHLFDNIKKAGFNAVIFQIRPACDAFYPSKLNPWSRYLTGMAGRGLAERFDPLRHLIQEAHKRNLEFHAWLNPYRVGVTDIPTMYSFLRTLAPDSFAALNPNLLLSVPADGRKLVILNPGEPQVLLHLSDTVREILEEYHVDAIHFDDYFYPYQEIGTLDAKTYRKYGNRLTLEDWRRANVDRMIETVRKLILRHNREKNRHVRFGVSPFGIWANKPYSDKMNPGKQKAPSSPFGSLSSGMQSYYRQYTDTRKWVKNGWVDYIVPQIYWSFSHKNAPYAALVDWWADIVKGTGVELYIGHGVYRAGVQPDWKDPNEIPNQMRFNVLRPEIKGSVFFSCRRVFQPENDIMRDAIKTVIESYWGGKIPAQP